MRKQLVWMLCIACVLVVACSQRPSDLVMTTDLKSKIFSDPELKDLNLEISVKDGQITLGGEVPNAELQLKAYKLATSVVGVSKVVDAMKVAPPPLAAAEATLPPAPPTTVESYEARPARTTPPPVRQEAKRSTPPPAPADRAGAAPAQTPASVPTTTLPPAAPAQAEQRDQAPKLEAPAQSVASATRQEAAPTPKTPPKPQKVQVSIPVDTPFTIRMVDSIDSAVNKIGEVFRATLENPIVVDGKEIVPVKTEVFVELVQARSAGKMSGQSELELSLHSIEFAGETYRLSSTTYEQVGKSRGKDTAMKVGIATGIGAAIGAIAGGGKGAAIGAGVGAGAGVAVQAITKGQQVKVPTETQLEFLLKNPVVVTYTSR
jgi:hypothetical protein